MRWSSPVVLANLALLALYPLAWTAPVARAGWLPFFKGDAVTILGGVRQLWESDAALAALVAVFAIAVPYAKTVILGLVHLARLGPEVLGLIETVNKLAMADVFLIALYIVLVKGVGIGHVTSAWGLWLFTGCVLASFWAGFETRRKLARGRRR